MRKYIPFIAAIIFFLVCIAIVGQEKQPVEPTRSWEVTAVDTVKYSRDPSRDPNIVSAIKPLVTQAAKLNITHIALGTPYDEEFYPILKRWVAEARKQHLKVWFRGNFSGWEGWFGYPNFTSIDDHNKMTMAFIKKHSDLFENGDIFTPIPEMENGGPGDPRGDDSKAALFNHNLVSSYDNCISAFQAIHKKVTCGYFSTNGDVANSVITPDTVKHIGNVIAIDHYVDSAKSMQEELDFLNNKFPGSKIVLGEFGAPIPDINGQMTEKQQSDFLRELLTVLYQNRVRVAAVDYWTLAGGSTSLLNEDFTEKQAFSTVASFYLPQNK